MEALVLEGPVWDLNDLEISQTVPKNGRIHGVLVLDVDGTLTRPGFDYLVDYGAISAVGDFLLKGGHVIFCTGATKGRIEDTVLTPLFTYMEGHPTGKFENTYKNIILIPENGSALLSLFEVVITENQLNFRWNRLHQLEVPQKKELRELLEQHVVPQYPGSQVWSDQITDPLPRDYIVSLKGLQRGSPPQVIQEILRMRSSFPEINWERISMAAARTTVDFIHVESGQTPSLRWLLKECSGLVNMTGPIIGFGDLGDEFAKVVPTFNVNRNRPNEFRARQMPALDFCAAWQLLKPEEYVVVGKKASQKILSAEDGKELPVLRNESGNVIYATDQPHPDSGKPVLRVAESAGAHPIKIPFTIADRDRRFQLLQVESFTKVRGPDREIIVDNATGEHIPVLTTSDGQLVYADRISRTTGFPHLCGEGYGVPIEVIRPDSKRRAYYDIQDAGQSTAWLIRRLMNIGYFS